MSLGENIKTLRNELGLTQKKLSNSINVDQTYISELENNKKTPSLDTLKKLAKVLNVRVSDLIGDTSNNLRPELKRLLDTTKNLDTEEIEALINLVNTFNKDDEHSSGSKEESSDKVTPIPKPKDENYTVTEAAHYVGKDGLTDEDWELVKKAEKQAIENYEKRKKHKDK